jgi:hypothetical protein
MRKWTIVATLAVAGSLAGAPRDAGAQATFGAEALFGTDTDFGIGGRIHADLGTSAPLEFQAAFDLFFPEGPAEYWEINANLWYEIESAGGAVQPYLGGGLNIGHGSGGNGFSDTDLGLNLGGGVKFIGRNTTPFIEGRFTVGGIEQFVIGGGVLLGGS